MNKKIILAVLPIAVFLLGWEVAARLEWINSVLFPAPTAILFKLVDLFEKGLPVQSELLTHTLATLKRLGIGFSMGALIGIVMGVAMGLSNPLFHFFNPLILVLMSIPGIALAPLFIIWLGFGDPTIITLGALSTFFPVVYSTTTGCAQRGQADGAGCPDYGRYAAAGHHRRLHSLVSRLCLQRRQTRSCARLDDRHRGGVRSRQQLRAWAT